MYLLILRVQIKKKEKKSAKNLSNDAYAVFVCVCVFFFWFFIKHMLWVPIWTVRVKTIGISVLGKANKFLTVVSYLEFDLKKTWFSSELLHIFWMM